MTYFNEFESYPAEWIRNLHPESHVDERSICDVTPADVLEYERCHFFAGIGGWQYALELAGWPVGRPVWTGSCPCQPFSSAGARKGTSDERHLWPTWFKLIQECRPPFIFGEQVASFGTVGRVEKTEMEKVWESLPQATSSNGSNEARQSSSRKKGSSVQSSRSSRADSVTNRQGDLRSNGNAPEPGRRKDLGQPIDRQNRAEEGISLFEYSDCVPRRKQCNGRLGRECICEDGDGRNEKTAREIERFINILSEESKEEFSWPWFDGVQADLERAGYTVGASVLPACSINAPHNRSRLYWAAYRIPDAQVVGCNQSEPQLEMPGEGNRKSGCQRSASGCICGRMAYSNSGRFQELEEPDGEQESGREIQQRPDIDGCSGLSRMGDGFDARPQRHTGNVANGSQPRRQSAEQAGSIAKASPWAASKRILCRDGKWRRIPDVKPSIQPLAYGIPRGLGKGRPKDQRMAISAARNCRVGQLKGYGNAIVPHLAAMFIRAFMESTFDQ